MKIVKPASAGTLESSDIEIRIEPADEAGIEVHLTSSRPRVSVDTDFTTLATQ